MTTENGFMLPSLVKELAHGRYLRLGHKPGPCRSWPLRGNDSAGKPKSFGPSHGADVE